MRSIAPALIGLACAAILAAGPASAYDIDPLTKHPLDASLANLKRQKFANAGAAAFGGGQVRMVEASPIPREVVPYESDLPTGSVYINTEERRLYYILGGGQAMRYGIGVGRPGFTWSGEHKVTLKREWPDWRPPAAMQARRPDLPTYMKGGIENPLGARALYLGSSEYRIHGSNEPETIGTSTSSGCIRMTNQDVTELYSKVPVGARVVVK